MAELFDSLIALFAALFHVVKALVVFVLPFLPLIAWVSFWTFAVNWVKLYEVLFRKGGIVGLLLGCFMWVLIWGLIAPPVDGTHAMLGLKVGNFVAKFVYVASLVAIMFMAASVQLSGMLNCCCSFEEPAADDGDHGHSHDAHGGHDDHGHQATAAHGH